MQGLLFNNELEWPRDVNRDDGEWSRPVPGKLRSLLHSTLNKTCPAKVAVILPPDFWQASATMA